MNVFNTNSSLPPPDSVDSAAFADACAILGNKLGLVLGYYIHDAELYLAQIETAMQHNDLQAAISPAHTLKSLSRQFGAMNVADLAERIETGARARGDDKDSENLTSLATPLREAFDEVRPYFQAMIGQ